jgi:hypothetical protein
MTTSGSRSSWLSRKSSRPCVSSPSGASELAGKSLRFAVTMRSARPRRAAATTCRSSSLGSTMPFKQWLPTAHAGIVEGQVHGFGAPAGWPVGEFRMDVLHHRGRLALRHQTRPSHQSEQRLPREWKAPLVRAGVRHARLHDARHTAATVLLVLGVPERTVMSIMGWSSTSMAARYQHVTQPIRREVANRVGGLLFGEAGRKDA